LRLGELLNVGDGDSLLVRTREENGGTILWADIGALPIEFSRIMRCKEDLQKLSVRNLRWIINNFDGFRVSGLARSDNLVTRGVRSATRVSGDCLLHSLGVLEDRLDSPEAASGEHRDPVAARAAVFIDDGGRNGSEKQEGEHD